MRILLDTHVAIWALADDDRLGPAARRLLLDAGNSLWVSAASIWEISIKFALRRPGSPPFSGADGLRHFRHAGFRLLEITPEHAAAVDGLPYLHADPFDRLLVAQALTEPMRLLTADATVAAYSDSIIKV